MHPEHKEEDLGSSPPKQRKKSGHTLGVLIFSTLFGLWLMVTVMGLTSSSTEDFHLPQQTMQEKTAPVSKPEKKPAIPFEKDGSVAILLLPQTPPISSDKNAVENPAPASAQAVNETPETAPQAPEKSRPVPAPPKEYPEVLGWTFVKAAMEPMHYELYDRFWGWRPNDILTITDNVNNFQLGVLEVTRRTAIELADDISRTGSTSSFDPDLEAAMNGFMIQSGKFWFPSAESEYKKALASLSKYQKKLLESQATFFNRPDNLIPLLESYKNLLESCEDNLAKTNENNGTRVSFFKAEDYFYYAQGVASAIAVILKAVEHDFYPILQSRSGLDQLEHAISSCEKGIKLDPFIVLNSNLNSLLANHRANLAVHISHASFYVGALIVTLST